MTEQSIDDDLEQRFAAQGFIKIVRELERESLEDLVYYQAVKLEELVRHARSYVPYYQDRVSAVFDQDDNIDFGRWTDVPILTREKAETIADGLKADMIPAKVGNYVEDQTTGSSGSAFYFIKSSAAAVADAGNSLRIFLDHQFDVNAPFADIRLDIMGSAQYPDGDEQSDWSQGEGDGAYVLLDINTPTEHQVEWLLRKKARILFTWASNAREIALYLEKTGRELELANLVTSAEPCTEAVKEDCLRVFGTAPLDILGARELGVIAFPCHSAPVYHFAAESAFFEVINDEGEPARPGEAGRLVGTGFFNYHMPFIRYATGDYVTLSEGPCVCGRSLPAITAIHGRDRNRYRRRDGQLVIPKIQEKAFDELLGVMAWQMVQTAEGTCEIRTENASSSFQPDHHDRLCRLACDAVDEQVQLSMAKAPAAGPVRQKRERFIRETN